MKIVAKTSVGGIVYELTQNELKQSAASKFKENDIIRVSKYSILIQYGEYNTPVLMTTVVDRYTCKQLDCTPGTGTPYYIDDFKNR